MHLPIQYAIYYPERKFLAGQRLNFYELGKIEFFEPDYDTFPGLKLATKCKVAVCQLFIMQLMK